MGSWHEFMLDKGPATKRHVVLWAHGGGVTEQSGLEIAQRHLNWWLNKGVYPITMRLGDRSVRDPGSALEDAVRGILPVGGVGFDLMEQLDRLVEGSCRRRSAGRWREMKENAERASVGTPGSAVVPGARAVWWSSWRQYVAQTRRGQRPDPPAGHSAGSVYQGAMLGAFAAAGLKVDTMTWLAPAITVERFRERVLPRLGRSSGGIVRRFSCFNLSDTLELDDAVEPVYHKSAVYLVARGVEDGLDGKVVRGAGRRPGQVLDAAGRACRQDAPRGGRGARRATDRRPFRRPHRRPADAMTHAAFDKDSPTMTSVAMRILGVTGNPDAHAYQPYGAAPGPG